MSLTFLSDKPLLSAFQFLNGIPRDWISLRVNRQLYTSLALRWVKENT